MTRPGSGQKHPPSWLRLGMAGGLLACLGGGVLALTVDHLFPPDLRRAHAQALVLYDATHTRLDGRVSTDGSWRLTTNHAAVDAAYLALLLKTEDRRFWWHPGVDPFSILRAAGQLAFRGHIVSGGSTLAIQTARLLIPHRHTCRGKVPEALPAPLLAWRSGHSARPILTMPPPLLGGGLYSSFSLTLLCLRI